MITPVARHSRAQRERGLELSRLVVRVVAFLIVIIRGGQSGLYSYYVISINRAVVGSFLVANQLGRS